jgi:hypothetical protein
MLTDHCIYTIRQSDELRAVAADNGHARYTEGKRWVSAKRMVDAARRWQSNDHVPIIFAPAEDTRSLFAWAILRNLTLSAKTTTYEFSHLLLFDDPPLKTALCKVSNGKSLDYAFNRPYAICRTPSFLADEVERFAMCALGLH